MNESQIWQRYDNLMSTLSKPSKASPKAKPKFAKSESNPYLRRFRKELFRHGVNKKSLASISIAPGKQHLTPVVVIT